MSHGPPSGVAHLDLQLTCKPTEHKANGECARMDNTIETPLLDGHDRHHSVVLPALQKLLQLAHSQDTDKQIEVRLLLCTLVV